MKGKFALVSLFTFLIIILISGCSCSRQSEGEVPPIEPTDNLPVEIPVFPDEELILEGLEDTEVFLGAGALSQEAEVLVSDLGEGVPFAAPSPLSAASTEYAVDFGDAEQIGEITMTVPLYGAAKGAARTSGDLVYLTWAQPEEGDPSVVGTMVENNLATFPIVGAGRYQVFSLKSHAALMEIVSIFDPLAVPTYPQMTPAWCSPTAMTNLVQFHQGAWPAGGLGSKWGETSNWYIAGQAGQPYEEGRFFHQVLSAGGYYAPEDVKQSFSNEVAEVIIWNWLAQVYSGFSNPVFANMLFDAFQAYVEHQLWGVAGARRPVAFGSSLVGHSRTITGSDGQVFYLNNPSFGSLNDPKSWELYRGEVLASLTAEKIEVADTVVIYTEPRPTAERRGVIWLLPKDDNGFPGSVALISGIPGSPVTNWHWDGAMLHRYGYYYEDLVGNLPMDPYLDSNFKAYQYSDRVEFGFAVQNITNRSYDYSVYVSLFDLDQDFTKTVAQIDTSVPAGSRKNFFPAGNFSILNLPNGFYTLKFMLYQDGVRQDVKYVHFSLTETDLGIIDPHGILRVPAFCRLGPSTDYPAEIVVNANVAVRLVGKNAENTWAKVEHIVDADHFFCWIAYSVLDLSGEDEVAVVAAPPMPVEFFCSIYETQPDCEADSRCKWAITAGPGYCTEK